jgi:hypothetical protein
MKDAVTKSADAQALVDSSVDREELVRLRRAFKAVIRRCEQAKDTQEQWDAVRELGRVVGKFSRVARRVSKNQRDMRPKLLDMLGKMTNETYELCSGPVLSKFSRSGEAGER